mgnify:CR=1 FL=1|jgi:hypothetical protein
MKDNKLIAEFMGLRTNSYGDYNIDKDVMGFDMIVCSLADTKFHESWDWLMPVAEKCLTTGDRQHYVINDALLTCNIEEVYKAVVEFIKGCNDEKQ